MAQNRSEFIFAVQVFRAEEGEKILGGVYRVRSA